MNVALLSWLAALLAPGNALVLPARRRIYEYIHAYPGMHLREVARATDLDPNHAKYHLAYLERHGLLSSRREEGYWRFWPRTEGTIGWREEVPAEHKTQVGLLRRRVPLHVVVLLLEREVMTHGAIRAEVGVSPSTLHYHMRHLEGHGLVASVRKGRERLYRLADAGFVRALLGRYRPPDTLVANMTGFPERTEAPPVAAAVT